MNKMKIEKRKNVLIRTCPTFMPLCFSEAMFAMLCRIHGKVNNSQKIIRTERNSTTDFSKYGGSGMRSKLSSKPLPLTSFSSICWEIIALWTIERFFALVKQFTVFVNLSKLQKKVIKIPRKRRYQTVFKLTNRKKRASKCFLKPLIKRDTASISRKNVLKLLTKTWGKF